MPPWLQQMFLGYIPHNAGLKALKNALDKRENSPNPTKKIARVAKFFLKINFFEFNGAVKEQKSGTAIGTKCAPSYACTFMNEFETKFIEA